MIRKQSNLKTFQRGPRLGITIDLVLGKELELGLELYFYFNTVNLSDKIIIIKITIY